MRKKLLLSALITIVVGSCLFYIARQLPIVKETREASMLKFLSYNLYDYRQKHNEFPLSFEEGIKNGLLDDFPKDRIEYLQQAMHEGRLNYLRTNDGDCRIKLTTKLNRELVIEGIND